MRSLSVALVLALAAATQAQPPRPFEPPAGRPNAELDRLRAEIKELEAKWKAVKEAEKKPQLKTDGLKFEIRLDEPKKGEPKKEEPRGPMGPGSGFGGPGGGFGPMGGFGGGWGWGGDRRPGGPQAGGSGDQPTPPGFDKLTKDEQQMFRKLMEKMLQPERKAEQAPKGGNSVEARLERLEKAIQDIQGMLRGGQPGGRGGEGPGGRGGEGPGGRGGPGGPGGPGGGPGGPGGRGPGR